MKEQMPNTQDSIVSKIFDLRGKFAIIGLTGRTGSGCSTAANILSTEQFSQLALPTPARNGDALTNNERTYQICYDYLKENWVPAITIKATHIIVWRCLLFDFNTFVNKFEQRYNESIDKETDALKKEKLQKEKDILRKHHQIFCQTDKSIGTDANKHFNTLYEKQYKQEKFAQMQVNGSHFFNAKHPRHYTNLKKYIQDQGLSPVEIFQVLGNLIRKKQKKNILRKPHQVFCQTDKSIGTDANKHFNTLRQKQYKQANPVQTQIDEIYDFFNTKLPQYYTSLKKYIQDQGLSPVEIFQVLGNLIREEQKKNEPESSIIELTNLLIKFYRYYYGKYKGQKKTIIVIDALRNPYEILFLRERYSAFYVMSLNTSEEERRQRLFEKSYIDKQIEDCDRTEYPNKPELRDIYLRQNIERCNEISDIHLVNNHETNSAKPQELTKQIMHYMSLILHPGLVPPFPEERTMQIAYTAKYNSGCLSRQVGAVVTDDQFSIKSIGWNDVPEGQTPCILRNSLHVIDGLTDKMAYSEYEVSDKEFHDKLKTKVLRSIAPMSEDMKKRLKGRHVPYCFKDIHNDREKGQNNQIHTRSLHAEENAFLQIAKYGGQGIKGGKLFTTASPCELCSKKAYQLGIKEIYYIDLYPGISKKHILENGWARPEMKMFYGAIGRAYIHLYQPILSYKDEIQELLTPEGLSAQSSGPAQKTHA